MKLSACALSKLLLESNIVVEENCVLENNSSDEEEFSFDPSAEDFERRMEELGVPEYPEGLTFDQWAESLFAESGNYDPKSAARAKFVKGKHSNNLDKLRNGKGKVSESKKDYEEKKREIRRKLARAGDLQAESGDFDIGLEDELDLFSGYTEFVADVPKKMKKYLSVIEDVLCSLVTLSGVNNPYSAATGIWLLIKKLVNNDEALALTVYRAIFRDCSFDTIVRFFSDTSEKVDSAIGAAAGVFAESGKMSQSEKAVASWTGRLFESMEVLKSSELIHKIVKLISILVAAGFVGQSKKLSLSVAGLTLFSIQAAKEAATGSTLFDLIETSLTIGHLFMSKLWICFERRSLKPLFLSEWGGDEYHRQYTNLMAHGPDMLIGVKCKLWPTFGSFVDNIRYVIAKTEQMISMAKAIEKRVLSSNLISLKKLLAKAEEKEADGGLRPAPFSFIVSGASSAGKSTIINILIDFALKRIAWEDGNKEFVTDPRCVAVSNEADDYDSDIHAFTLATLDDDKANAAFAHCKTNPTSVDIRFINNIKRKAIKAALDEKDRIPLQPLVSAASTNVPWAWAWEFTNAPESALRRYIMHIRASIKDDWVAPRPKNLRDKDGAPVSQDLKFSKLNHTKLVDQADQEDFYPDAWNFKVTEWLPVTEGGQERKITEQCEPIEVVQSFYSERHQKEIQCLSIGFPDLLDLMKIRISAHTKTQNSVVKSSDGVFAQQLCEHGNVTNFCPCCRRKKEEEEAQLRAESSWSDAEKELSEAEENFGRAYKCVKHLRRNPFAFCFAFMPLWATRNPWVVSLLAYLTNHDNLINFLWFNLVVFIMNWIGFVTCNVGVRSVGLYMVGHILFVTCVLSFLYKKCFDRIATDRLIITEFIKTAYTVQSKWRRYLVFGFSTSLSLLGAIKLWRIFKSENGLQSEGQALFINKNDTPNPWLTVQKKPLPQSVPVNSQYKDLAKKVEAAQVLVRYHNDENGPGSWSNGFIPFSGYMLLPHHEVRNIPKRGLKISIQDSAPDTLSGLNFTTNITSDSIRLVGEVGKSDLALVSIPRIGKRSNLCEMFLAKDEWTNAEVATNMFFRTPECDIVQYPSRFYRFDSCTTLSDTAFEKAAWYKWQEASFPGLCLSTHVYVHGSRAYIAGFHLAGTQKAGCDNVAQMVNRDELWRTKNSFPKTTNPDIADIGTVPTEMYGIDFTPVHKDGLETNLGYQTQAQADYYGTLPNARVRPKSSVVKSPIADEVEDVTGCPQKWGPPPNCRKDAEGRKVLKEYEPYQKFLSGAGNAYQEFRPATLEKARADYMKTIETLFAEGSEPVEYAAKLCPLDPVEVVSGQDGVKFVDAMKPNTSMAFPLNKPKQEFLRDLVPEDHPHHSCPRAIADMVIEQAEHCRNEYRKGRSANPIFKNCTKDEPTNLEKMKARVFQAAPAHFQLLVREYFLPIAAFMSRYPHVFECAVGINAHGPQWDELMKHISSVGGGKRQVAGDFKAYDQHMSARMILVALNIMIDVAEEHMDYSEDDIAIMRFMASDIAFPLVSINGDLTQLFGSNPSGHNLTVYVNSIVNSLYQRCVFFEIYPDHEGMFSEVVKLTTYGDDNLMGVHESVPEYNHTRMAEIYDEHDIVFTMAQKEADSVPFITMDDVEYLKRWSRFDSTLAYIKSNGEREKGMYISMLDEESIFKSLMQNIKSKTEPQSQVAIQCIENAMREWFFYGKETFDERHAQMKEIVSRKNYTNWMQTSFWDSYEDREGEWMAKYGITREE